jgi:hypothetical protein
MDFLRRLGSQLWTGTGLFDIGVALHRTGKGIAKENAAV